MGGSPSPSRHTPHVRPSRLWRHLPAPADSGAAGVRDTASPPPPARVPVSSRRPHSQITVDIAASGVGGTLIPRDFAAFIGFSARGNHLRLPDVAVVRMETFRFSESETTTCVSIIAAASETISVPRSSARAVRGSRHNRKRSMEESSGARRLFPYPEQLDQ